MEIKLNKYRLIYITLILFGIVLNIGCTQSEVPKVDKAGIEASGLEWSEDFEASLSLAKEKDLPILINFTGSDWCGWCFKLHDEVFAQPEFIEYAEKNFVLFKADFPKSVPQPDELKAQNQMLMKKYGVRGFPTIMLVSHDGTTLAQTGYQQGGPTKYIEHLEELLKK